MDFAQIGIAPSEMLQTLTAMAPNLMLQEKLSPEQAAARAFALLVACAEEVERAYWRQQPLTQSREDAVQARPGSIKDGPSADERARDFAARQVLTRQHSVETREPLNQA